MHKSSHVSFPQTLNPKPSVKAILSLLGRGLECMQLGRRLGGHSEWLRGPAESSLGLPLVSREWRNGVQLSLLLLPFFHSLLTKGELEDLLFFECLLYAFRPLSLSPSCSSPPGRSRRVVVDGVAAPAAATATRFRV